MTARAAKIRWSLLAGLVGLLAAGSAQAQTTTCMFDKDCPGTGCGSQVCIMSSGSGHCADANTEGASGISDGWCGNDAANCKCPGATCSLFCSFTIPSGAGGTTGGGGTSGSAGTTGAGGTASGGSTGHAGTSGGGGGGDGCSVAGAPSLGGAGIGLFLFAAMMRRRVRRRR